LREKALASESGRYKVDFVQRVMMAIAAVRIRNLLFSPRMVLANLRYFLGIWMLLSGCGVCVAQTPEEAVRGLARRIAEMRELPEKVSLEWVNISSLPEAESIVLRAVFVKELGRRVVTAEEPAIAALQVSVRETPTNFLLVARMLMNGGEQVRMAELPRVGFLPVMATGSGLRLAKQLLWQQPETILDAGELSGTPGSSPNICLLRPDAVAIYREADERLSEIQELPFPGYKYVSRDLRGELHPSKDGATAVALPGLNCVVRGPAAEGERWTMSCVAGNGVKGNASSVTTSSTAGTKRGSDVEPQQVATLRSNCDGNGWRLLSAGSDWTQPDRLLLVNAESKREESVASLDFAGPLRRLAGGEDGKSALAVVFNLTSGSYEVYRITMVCGR
jgi:hypothetical protein